AALPAFRATLALPIHPASSGRPTLPSKRAAISLQSACCAPLHTPASRMSLRVSVLPHLQCAPAVELPEASSTHHPASATRSAPQNSSRTRHHETACRLRLAHGR